MKNIAVVGISCRFPGANSYQEFWQNLLEGVNSVKEIPATRWDWQDFYGEPVQGENKTNSKWGGFIDGVEKFDAAFFGISPREAEQMDPQQRLALELAWQCIDNAGYVHEHLSGKDIGVYVGVSTFDYKELQEKNSPAIEGHSATGIHNTIVPNRISYFFNFFGPSIAIDSACAGSLVSIHQAINAINNGECEAALAGGVSVLATPTTFIRFSKVGMLSPTGSCKTFDEDADGYVRGEGGGFIFLKPLAKAIADKDNIWGVIKGSAVNHGGRARSITAPSALSQSKVITAALRDAQISPATIGFIEAHGTGTPLGDPIEILGLSRAFNGISKKDGISLDDNYCAISAVKTNIGHLEAAAGIAGCIKTLLALKYKKIPGNSNFNKLNSRIKLENTPFTVLKAPINWNRFKNVDATEIPLRAGISSFGFGGVNCHIVLEEPPFTPTNINKANITTEENNYLLCLSAHSQTQLENLKNDYANLIGSNNFPLSDLITTAMKRQSTLAYREAFVGKNAQELIEKLSQPKTISGTNHVDSAKIIDSPKIGFMFTGQGSQYLGMGKELYEKLPPFRNYFKQCDALFETHLGLSLHALINSNNTEQLNKTEYSQPAIFALEYALAKTLMDIGIKPEAMIGHSIGELVAACLAKVISLNDAVALISCRAELMGSVNIPGGMQAIFQDFAWTNKFIKENNLTLDIAAINAPDTTVISGRLEELEKCKHLLEKNGIESKSLNVSQAFHSSLMETIQSDFYKTIANLQFNTPEIPVISNVTGELLSEANCNARYWADHIRKPVNFSGGIEFAKNLGINLWIEIGSAAVLCSLVRRHQNLHSVNTINCLKQGTPELNNILNLLGTLFTAGVSVNLDKLELFEEIYIQKPTLPVRKFEGMAYWIPQSNKNSPTGKVKSLLSTANCSERLLGHRLSVAGKGQNETYFFSEYSADELALLKDHQVVNRPVMPGAAFISMALSAGREVCSKNDSEKIVTVVDAMFLRPIIVENTIGLQTLVRKTEDSDTYNFEIWSSDCSLESENKTSWEMNAKGTIQATDAINLKSNNTANFATTPFTANDSQVENNQLENSSTFYEQVNSLGFGYGPAFQGIVSNKTQGNTSFTKIKLSNLQKGNFEFTQIRALDSIFQSALSLLPRNEQSDSIPLPFTIDQIAFKDEIPNECFVSVEIAESSKLNSYEFNLLVLDESKEILGKITGLKLKSTPKSVIYEKNVELDKEIDFCFTQQFVEADINDLIDKNLTSHKNSHTLIFCSKDSHALAVAIKEAINSDNLLIISDDQEIANEKSIDIWVKDYRKENLGATISSCREIDSIFYLAGYFNDLDILTAVNNLDFINRTKKLGIDSFIQLCKTLADLNFTDSSIVLKIITNQTMNIPQDSYLNPWGAPVIGAAKVFAKEYPLVSLFNIDIASSEINNKENAECIVSINKPVDNSSEYAIRGKHIYARSFHSINFDDTHQITLKPNGVYLIIGGAGGIGFSLTKYLAKHFSANVAWLGRRSQDEEIDTKIHEIETHGGKVLYIQADAAVAGDMTQAVDTIEKTYGKLNGAFHSALVLNDSAILSLTDEKFNSVMASKFEASINLFNSAKEKQLDFIAFFSSANSIIANKGQASYVAASAFEDAFAFAISIAKAQSTPIKLINWGYCGDVGVVASQQYRERLKAQGIESIDENECLSIIKQSLSSSFTQVIPFKARKDVLANIGFHTDTRENIAKNTTPLLENWQDRYQYKKSDFSFDLDCFTASHQQLNTFSAKLILKTFNAILGSRSQFAESNLKEILLGKTSHEKFIVSALDMLEAEGSLQKNAGVINFDFSSVVQLSWPALELEMNDLLTRYPWLEPELAITWQCGLNLQKILAGEINSTEIIFPNMSMHLVEGVYKNGYLSQYFNAQTAEVVCNALASISIANAKVVRILEIGAGTGSTSHVVLEKIKSFLGSHNELRIEYVYTDISNAFLQYGSLHYEEKYPFVKFSLLNVEHNPGSQNYEKNSFDIVIASNVLHATTALKETLGNIKWLMKKDALLVLNELTKRRNYLTLTFGLLAGWWLSTDLKLRIPNSPLLSPTSWNNLLDELGFTSFNEYQVDSNIEKCKYQSVMSAQSDGHYFEKIAPANSPTVITTKEESKEYPFVGTDDILALPHTATKPEVQESLLMYLRWQLVDVLRITIKSLFETRINFTEMLLSELGMDSLTAMDLRNRFKKQLKIDVPVEILLGGGKVASIIDHIYNQLLMQRLMNGNSAENQNNTTSDANKDENIEEFLI